MRSDLAKIKFYFPNITSRASNKHKLVSLIMEAMHADGTIKYAGYLKERDLRDDLLRHIGNKGTVAYAPLSVRKRQNLENIIRSAVTDCHKVLPHPDPPIFIFVYPWFPKATDRVAFGGITALAVYYTMHLFIDADSCTKKSVRETIAHEWNHLVFYRYLFEKDYTLRIHITMEGLAEVFREEVMGGKPSPWALALTESEAREQYMAFRGALEMKGMKIYREVFFGSRKYKRWTGYSVGYRLVKIFREKHPELSWEEILKMRPEKILGMTKKTGRNG